MSEVPSLLADGPRLVLTNRFNLLHVLSCGFIPPRSGFEKYYDDLLALSPGRAVVFSGAVSESVAALVQATPTAFPVLISLGSVPDLEAAPVFTPRQGAAPAAWAPEAPLALGVSVVVHFRSETDKVEHETRRFANVPSRPELRVSPDLFSGHLDARALLEWLASLEAPPPRRGLSARSLDKRLGGVCLLAEARRRGGQPEAADVLLGDVLTEGPDSARGALGLRPGTLDDAVFDRAAALMEESDPEQGLQPQAFLTQLRKRVTVHPLSEEDAAALDLNLSRAEAVLRGEEELRPLKAGQGLQSVKAVLLALLRRDPDRLFGLASRDAGDDPMTVEAAAFLLGLATGRMWLPLEYRPVEADRRLAAASVGWLKHTPTVASAPETNKERVLAMDGSDADQRRRLARLCLLLGWEDLVSTVLVGPSAAVAPARVGHLAGVGVTLPGVVDPDYELDVLGLRARVEEAEGADFESGAVAACLSVEAGSKPRRRRVRKPPTSVPD